MNRDLWVQHLPPTVQGSRQGDPDQGDKNGGEKIISSIRGKLHAKNRGEKQKKPVLLLLMLNC